jgi:hypothetical protein
MVPLSGTLDKKMKEKIMMMMMMITMMHQSNDPIEKGRNHHHPKGKGRNVMNRVMLVVIVNRTVSHMMSFPSTGETPNRRDWRHDDSKVMHYFIQSCRNVESSTSRLLPFILHTPIDTYLRCLASSIASNSNGSFHFFLFGNPYPLFSIMQHVYPCFAWSFNQQCTAKSIVPFTLATASCF